MLDVSHVGATLLGHEVGLPDRPAAVPSRGRLRFQPPHNPAVIDLVRDRVLSRSTEYAAHGPGLSFATFGDAEARPLPSYYLLAADDDPHDPDEAFRALRWGGQFIYASHRRRRVAELPGQFIRRGFEIAGAPTFVRKPVLGMSLPLISR